jgi:glycosyltransferase involved in cell wall biosynthesis
MKALHIDQATANPESPQKKSHEAIKGADIFGWNLLSALLEYGTYDTYLLQGLSEEKKQILLDSGLSASSAKRMVPVPFGGPLPLKDSDSLVFLTAGRYLNALATLRHKLRRFDAPACGFIHSINSPRIVLALLQQCFVGLSETDLLFCSSRAGMKTIDAYVDEINRLLPSELHYAVRRVLVPLGVSMPVVAQDARARLRQNINVESEAVLALYFGRLSQASKCDLGPLLVAFGRLVKRGTKLCLILAGDDTQSNEAPRLESLAQELGCENNVRVWPNPSAQEKHVLYSGADFFVSPSDNMQETFGLAVAEALAYGLPAIVSDWNGYRDLVKDGETGFLIPSVLPPGFEDLRLCDCVTSMLEEDSLAQSTTIDVYALSDRMEKLVADRDLRMRMGQAARRFAECTCSWRAVVKRYEELWEESLKTASANNSRSGGACRLLSLPLEKCFGHYASTKRSREEKCFLTEEGREWLRRPARFYFLNQSSAACPEQFAHILRKISGSPGVSVSEAANSVVGAAGIESTSAAYWALARLFKYGLVSDKEGISRG